MQIRVFLILLILAILSPDAESQKWKLRRYEAIVGIGTLNYFGDVGGSADEDNLFGLKDIQLFQTRPAVYVGARYKIRNNLAVKTNISFGFISGDDNGTYHQTGPNDRNYQFSSKLLETSAQIEYSLISEERRLRSSAIYGRRGMLNNFGKVNVYLFAGVGSAFYWPKPNDEMLNSKWYIADYKKVGLVVPGGIGVKYVLSSTWSAGIEFGGRYTRTDYLDAWGNPKFSKYNDIYYFGAIHAIYRIKTSRRGYPIIFGIRRRTFL